MVTKYILVYALVAMLALFLPSARLDWIMGWIYVGLSTAGLIVGAAIVARTSPDLLVERTKSHKDAKNWDKVFSPFIALPGPALIWVTAGFDRRFQWSTAVPLDVQIAALAIMLIGTALVVWAMVSNRFFSSVVRIQHDRGHKVANFGPYRCVRHPGYVGFMVGYLATPLVLGSLWAFIPAGVIIAVTLIRTWLEDETLKHELDGYEEYTSRVRYRLVPGLW